MKHTLSGPHLIWVVMLWTLALLLTNTTMGLQLTGFGIPEHISRLHSLYFQDREASMWILTKNSRLNITNGLVVGSNVTSEAVATVAWGNGNVISNGSTRAWIGGGILNKIINGKYSIIGWWKSNEVNWNNVIIAWWENNKWNADGAVVLWWRWNTSSNGWVVFWGSGNTALWASSLVLWEGAVWARWSFAWNGEAGSDSARIDANNWVLIGTYETVDWANLVVNWAIKIWWDSDKVPVMWEMRMVDGCFYAYDGANWHVINQSITGCTALQTAKTCRFGNVELQAWDKVIAYKTNVSIDCDKESVQVTCTDWKLKNGDDESYVYPYCHNWTGDLISPSNPPAVTPVTCPAEWVCQESSVWSQCESYTTNSSSDCNSAKVISTCQSKLKTR